MAEVCLTSTPAQSSKTASPICNQKKKKKKKKKTNLFLLSAVFIPKFQATINKYCFDVNSYQAGFDKGALIRRVCLLSSVAVDKRAMRIKTDTYLSLRGEPTDREKERE